MFKSKKRRIAIPQTEHARLSGIIASLWGNEEFDLPALPHHSFVLGVTFHDRGYEWLDNAPIKEIGQNDWIRLQQRGAQGSFNDTVADLLVRFHVHRLLLAHATPERTEAAKTIHEEIQRLLTHHTLSEPEFLWADRITNFCDNISFDFCFEEKKAGGLGVQARRGSSELVDVRYEIADDGRALIDPWPLSVPEYRGFLIGYELDRYPEVQQPLIVPFELLPRNAAA